MKTKIIYEDNDILVCYKQPGLPVQSAKIGTIDMESELKNYLKKAVGSSYLGIVHRLDQPVGGIMVFAKNEGAAASLSQQVQAGSSKSMYKYYEAKCYGEIKEDGCLTDYLVKDNKSNSSKVVSPGDKNAKKAVLRYEVLEAHNEYTLLGVHLETGRHHQIRVQFAHMGHPLLGDKKYGTEESLKLSESLGIRNVQLTAMKLEFIHPSTKEKMLFDLSAGSL